MKCVGVIPARLHSQRLPRKALVSIAAQPMIYWVYRNACAAGLDDVVVATDHDEIASAVAQFGGRAMLTSADHRSGTERVAEVAERVDAAFFINIQGDEPLMSPDVIQAVATLLRSAKGALASAMIRMRDAESYRNPSVVKVVVDSCGKALYFSRSPIPCYRDGRLDYYFKHLGIYGYTRDFLTNLKRLPQSWLEEAEKLEQLRFLEGGYDIRMVEVEHDSIGVDTQDDLDRVRQLMSK